MRHAPQTPARSFSFDTFIVVSLFTRFNEYLLMALLIGSIK